MLTRWGKVGTSTSPPQTKPQGTLPWGPQGQKNKEKEPEWCDFYWRPQGQAGIWEPLPKLWIHIHVYTHTPLPKEPLSSQIVHFCVGPRLSPHEAAPYTWPEHPVGFDLKINLGHSSGFCLSACQEGSRKPAEFLSTPAPVHRVWWPMQVTAKLSLAKSQGHEAAGAGAEGCRWSGQPGPLVFSDPYSVPGQKPQTLPIPWGQSLLHPPEPSSTPIRA